MSANSVNPGSKPLLRAEALHKAYGRGRWPFRTLVPVLTGADLVMYEGEVVGLVGANGSGKSTLMRILVRDLRPDAGSVQCSGHIGYCPQVPALYERLTCDEHFALFAAASGMSATAATRSRDALYDNLDFGRFSKMRVSELSGGTLAKLNLGLALLQDPELLLLDEPYAGFDWDTYLRFWDIVATRRARGRSALIISHFIADEHRFDRVIRMRDGKAVG